MNTSLSWIKAYVPDLDVTAREYTDAMTLSGTKVEGYEELDADLSKIVVGQIDKIEKHPDADKLIICQVNIGSESVQIAVSYTHLDVYKRQWKHCGEFRASAKRILYHRERGGYICYKRRRIWAWYRHEPEWRQ